MTIPKFLSNVIGKVTAEKGIERLVALQPFSLIYSSKR
jgi:hypothetical protein